MSRPDSLNGSNPEMREEDGASKASVNRPVSYQPESREQPGRKGCGCGEAYKGPGTSGKLSSGFRREERGRSRPVRVIKGHRNRQSGHQHVQ